MIITKSTITDCYNTGKVSGKEYVGGVCGYNDVFDSETSTVTNCYNTGSVSGTSAVGGVCGINGAFFSNSTATVNKCYNTGEESGYSEVGGVCGSALFDFQPGTSYYSKIENCYYNTDIYSGYAVGNIVEGGTVCTKVEGKTSAKFRSGEVAYLLQNGQTADENGVTPEVWGQTIGTEDYPVLGGLPVYFRDEVYTNTYGILTIGTQTITASNEPLVWYEFTPSETGSYQFSSTQLTAGNLYVNTTQSESDYTDIATSPTYDLEAATTYYVAVSGAPGSYDLTITRLNNTPTAMEAVTAPQIYAVDGRIVCEGEFRIYDLLGRDVTCLNGSLCGVYVVQTANAAVKVVVR